MMTDDRISRIGAWAMALSLYAAPAHAQVSINDGLSCSTAFFGVWDADARRCTTVVDSTIPAGIRITVGTGVTLRIEHHVAVRGELVNNGTIDIARELEVFGGLRNHGTIHALANSFLDIEGEGALLENSSNGRVVVHNQADLDLESPFFGSGTRYIFNSGTIQILAGGDFFEADGTLTNHGLVEIVGYMATEGLVNGSPGSSSGTIIIWPGGEWRAFRNWKDTWNYGTILNYGEMNFSKFVVSGAGSSIRNHGTLVNRAGAKLWLESSSLFNDGDFDNFGFVDVSGGFSFSEGAFHNNTGGEVYNDDEIYIGNDFEKFVAQNGDFFNDGIMYLGCFSRITGDIKGQRPPTNVCAATGGISGVPPEQTVDGRENEPVPLIVRDYRGFPLDSSVVSVPGFGTFSSDFSPAASPATWTPPPGFLGTVQVVVRATWHSTGHLVTLTLDVKDVNLRPVADPQEVTTAAGVPTPISLTGSDGDGDSLFFQLVTFPLHGQLTHFVRPHYTYTPHPGFSGTDSFSFVVMDASLVSSQATVTIHVVKPTLTVTAGDASRRYGEANPVFTGSVSGLVNNDNISATYSTAATSSAPVGTYAIVPTLVDPDGELNNYAVVTINGTLSVVKADAQVTLTASAASSVFGQDVTFTAQLAAQPPGSGIPGGMVTFTATAPGRALAHLGTIPLEVDGRATLTIPGLSAGVYSISASYNGDAHFNGGAAGRLDHHVEKAPSGLTLTSSPSPSRFGDIVQFETRLSAAASGGSLTVTLDGAALFDPVTDISGSHTFAVNALSVGSHVVRAHYSGDANVAAGSAEILQTVGKADVQVAVVSLSNPLPFGQPVTFRARVTSPVDPLVGAPTGAVSFRQGVVVLGVTALDAAGDATLTTSFSSAGVHGVTAEYQGDGNFNPGDAAIEQTIFNPPPRLDRLGLNSMVKLDPAVGPRFVMLEVFGADFVPQSIVRWNGVDLETEFLETAPGARDRLIASVPAANLATSGVAYVTVFTPEHGGGGGLSALKEFFITDSPALVSDAATSTTDGGPLMVTIGGVGPSTPGSLTVEGAATGWARVTVAHYTDNPGGPANFKTGGQYFDVFVAPGSDLASLTITNCAPGPKRVNLVYFFDGTKWQRASRQSFDRLSNCVTVTLTDQAPPNETAPTLAGLVGTYFATSVDFTPPTTTAAASPAYSFGTWTNQPVTVTLTAQDESDGSGIAELRYSVTEAGAMPTQPSPTGVATFLVTAEGQTTITFSATDHAGNAEEPQTIHVLINAAPVLSAAAGQSADEGASAAFALGSFTDAGPGTPWAVSVTWGDGSAASTLASTSAGALPVALHTYADSGTYTVTVTITDQHGASDSGSFRVSVKNVAPALSGLEAQPNPVDEGSAMLLSLGFTDPGSSDAHTARWSFGDGSSSTQQVAAVGARTASIQQRYADDGVYTVTVMVDDGEGGNSEAREIRVQVLNVAPRFEPSLGPRSIAEGRTLRFEVRATDASSLDALTLGASGLPPRAAFVGGRDVGVVAAMFQWTPACDQAGDHVLTFRVQDDDGGVSEESVALSVEEACAAVVAVANEGDDTVAIVDAASQQVRDVVAVGHKPAALAFGEAPGTPGGGAARLYVTARSSGRNSGQHDGDEGEDEDDEHGDASDRRGILAMLSQDSGGRFDWTGIIDVGDRPVGVALTPDGTELWVALPNGDSIGIIDPATGRMLGVVPLRAPRLDKRGGHAGWTWVGRRPLAVAFSPDGAFAYVIAEESNALLVLDRARALADPSGAILASLAVGKKPAALAVHPAGGLVYVATREGLAVADVSTPTAPALRDMLPLSLRTDAGEPADREDDDDGDRGKQSAKHDLNGLAVASDGGVLYITDARDDVLWVVAIQPSPEHLRIMGFVPVGRRPAGVAVTPAGSRAAGDLIYVANGKDRTVSVVDSASGQVVATVAVGRTPVGVAAAIVATQP